VSNEKRAIYNVVAFVIAMASGWKLEGIVIAALVIAASEWQEWRERQEQLAWLQRNGPMQRAYEERLRMEVETLEDMGFVYNEKRGCWIRPDGSEYIPEPIEPPNYI